MKTHPGLSNYEKERQERIAENRKLLQTLQIDQAVKALEQQCNKDRPERRTRKVTCVKTALKKTAGVSKVRRSGRLKGKAPVYNEKMLGREIMGLKKMKRRRKSIDATKEEIYTEDHVQLLGSYKKEWELFVDGYDKDGVRVYDAVNGKTCHQCRQKTMGKRTWCSKCNKLRGCFCGDCLFMRYGENVDEVNAQCDWVCPGCRGICNCSFCRIAKGWAPTGSLYRRSTAEGYKSVAHYLILRNLTDKENVQPAHKNSDSKTRGIMTRSKIAAAND